jgi:predicted ArsR family transcriptional regulator
MTTSLIVNCSGWVDPRIRRCAQITRCLEGRSLTENATRQRILGALREGALDHFQIAADIGAAPFLVRAELDRLRRDQLVREQLVRTTVAWHLTEKGVEVAAGSTTATASSEVAEGS